MEITWYGHSCFRITERNQPTVVTDPYSSSIGLPDLKLKGSIVTVSHDADGHNNIKTVTNHDYVLSGSGEYEIGGVFINGIALHDVDAEQNRAISNVGYLIEFGNRLTVLHLGDLNHIPNQSTLEKMGEVDVALIPVGGGGGLTGTLAAEVVTLIEPHYVVPMHYAIPGLATELEPVDKFLTAMGISNVQVEDTLKVGKSDLPEQPQVIVLNSQN